MGMTADLQVKSQERLMIHGMLNEDGDMTDLGLFASKNGFSPEHAVLLSTAHGLGVMDPAISMVAMLARGGSLITRSLKERYTHPDGDLHTLLNVLNAAKWLEKITAPLHPPYKKENAWTKCGFSFRINQSVIKHEEEVRKKCEERFRAWTPNYDENASSRLALALFKAYKDTLLIRFPSGHYSSCGPAE